jgi:hypothetical protein
MTGRERVQRALTFRRPDRAPRDLWPLPGIEMFRQDELQALQARFPLDIAPPVFAYGRSPRQRGTPNVVGTYTDAWGCTWRVAQDGVVGEVKVPPLADWAALDRLRPPYEILEQADFRRVNASCAASEQFVLAWPTVRPFERLQFLRGTEALLMGLAYGEGEVLRLRDLVHEFFLAELEKWAGTDVDGIAFMDDWGSQRDLLISPRLWRQLFKPLYAEYCRLIHRAGKFAFFHSDGQIMKIIPDLIEIGVDALNAQLFCLDIEEIGRRFRGQITFWGEIDRTWVLAFGTPADVAAAVRRVRAALDDGRGGVLAQCEWGIGVKQENIEAVFTTWLEAAPGGRAHAL